MMKFSRPLENIFKDRREQSVDDRSKPANCRRRSSFDKADKSPWWLKVNYVNMDLKLVDKNDPSEQ